MKYYLAIDIGASSGRHIVGWEEDGEIKTEEVYRFPNGVKEVNGHLTWDIYSLLDSVYTGIDKALEKFPKIESLSVDTWGVDYVLLDGDKEILPVYAYRDDRTLEAIREVHSIIPFSSLYRHTGSQFQSFNSLYQFYTDKKAGRLDKADNYLMIPEYILWKLSGTKAHEYTNATTTGMVNAETGEIDKEIVERLSLPSSLFTPLSQPGTVLGSYKGIKCVLCATHDTASAVEGIPMIGNEAYISSGTWSLLGAKTKAPITSELSEKANYSNEGGVGYNRYQKNIMGMWLINRLRDDLCPDKPFSEIVKEAEESIYTETIDANSPLFLAPKSMKKAFDSALKTRPQKLGDYFKCAYISLALSYKKAIEELEENSGTTYSSIYIVGGGAKNDYLNALTEEATGKKVIALKIEATAIGNLKIQMENVK